MGISVELVTSRELFDHGRFNLLARRIGKSLGYRMRGRDYDAAWETRHRELRRELLAQFRTTETQGEPAYPAWESIDCAFENGCVTDFGIW